MAFFRYDGSTRINAGPVVAGANIAILTQPAVTTTQPGSPLATIYSGPTSNAATLNSASYNGGLIILVFSTTPPADVIPGGFINVSGVSPSGYNNTWEVVTVSGNNVTVAIPYTFTAANPGTYVSGGTVATSVLPNPFQSDGNGNWFFYAAVTLYTVQIYGGAIAIEQLVFPDQSIGTPGSGTITSLGLTMPAEFTVAGSPVSGSTGTFAVTKATQAANQVYAGPASGANAVPLFRALVAADITGLASGSVTSVGLSVVVPSRQTATITNSPLSSTGTLTATITDNAQTSNLVYAGPSSGGSGVPTFRALVAADIAGSVAGADTQVQVNSGGGLYADANFTYNHTTGVVAIAGATNVGGELNVTGLGTFAGNVQVGGTLDVFGEIVIGYGGGDPSPNLQFVGTTSGFANIGVASIAGTPNQINLPTTTGATGQALTTNGASPQQTGWTTVIAGTIATTQILVGNGTNTAHGDPNFTYYVGAGTPVLVLGTNPTNFTTIQGGGATVITSNDGTNHGTITLSPGQGQVLQVSSYAGVETVTFFSGVAFPQTTFTVGTMTIGGSTSGSAAIGVAAVAGTPNPIILPTTTGTAGQVLSTNGGSPQQTSWVNTNNLGATLTPATSGATGFAGQIAWDASYAYICVATNSWKRVAITTW
jgi:hypothetical protein